MERTVTVVPEAGLHARPAAKFVRTANQYDATVQVATDDQGPVDASSMIAVSGLAVPSETQVRLIAEGEDAEEALDALEELLSTPETGEEGAEGDESDGAEG